MEFSVSIALYVINESSCTSTFLDDVPVEDENTNVDGDNDDDDINAKAFTINGPPKYSGNILDDPDAVWLNDQWNDERIDEANKAVQKQIIGVPEFWKQKYFVKAGSYWDTFYVRNRDNFYKDRHYLHVVFPELAPIEGSNYFVTLLEVGCGVGNAILPLVELNSMMRVVAVDFARSAVDILKTHPLYSSTGRVQAFVCDVANDALPVSNSSLDFALCMYVLSAVPPQNHEEVIHKLGAALIPGGRILLRDYGRYDEAQLRFKSSSKIDTNLYVRQDGTLTYYFTTEEIESFCASYHDSEGCSLRVVENFYITRQYANRQQKKARYRVWIHSKIEKIKFNMST